MMYKIASFRHWDNSAQYKLLQADAVHWSDCGELAVYVVQSLPRQRSDRENRPSLAQSVPRSASEFAVGSKCTFP